MGTRTAARRRPVAGSITAQIVGPGSWEGTEKASWAGTLPCVSLTLGAGAVHVGARRATDGSARLGPVPASGAAADSSEAGRSLRRGVPAADDHHPGAERGGEHRLVPGGRAGAGVRRP